MKTFNEIDIKYYDNSGNVQVRCTVPVTQDALVHYELMQSHYCKLSFKLSRPTYFLLGDFIETPYGRFELIDLTKAKDNDTIGYSYEIQFDAYYRKLKNKILKYRPNTGSQEATFSLTSKISTHIEVIMKNLAYYAKLDKSYLYDPNFEGEGTDYTYVIDASVDANAAKLITYSNSSILDAIANIAQTFGCEWWFEGNILHFGTCENTNAITDFRLNENIVSMSSSQSKSTYANRVYAFGAARNLPSGYKNDSDADITKDGVVEKRLMLPTSAECSEQNKQMLAENGFELKNGYIQVGGLREDQYVEGVTTNDDIYPRNLIKTSKVTSYEKDVEDESTPEEGDYIKRTFYRVNSLTIVNDYGEKTGDMAFRKAYILSGKNLHIVFQSGSLNGMDFECEFNPDGVSEILKDDDGNPILKDGKEQINPKSQVFEIVANEDYGRFLPDITLHPKDGDTFVLYNWDSTKLGDTLVSSASNELLTDSIKDLKKSMIDPTTYTCTAEANYSYNHGRGNLHGVGDRVNLYNKGYGDGYRSSRVIGYEFSLDIPFDGAKYYVGEKPSYSRLNAMESKIEELIYNGQSYLNGNGGSGRSIYIIKSYDSITPTDYNVFSAKAVDEQRLNKTKDDIAKGTVTWEKVQKLLGGLLVGENFSFDKEGNIIAHSISSDGANIDEHKGFSIIQTDPNTGKYKLNIDELLAFSKATIMKQAKIGDKFVFDVERDFRFDAEGNIIAHSISSDGANIDEHKGFSIIQTDPNTGKYKLNIDELLAFSKATIMKQAKIGDKFVFDVERDFRFDAEGNIIAHSISSDGASEENGKGFTILQKDPLTNTYKLCIDEVIAYTVATVGKLFVNGNSRFGGELSSKQFISGFLGGLGWGIYNTPVTNAAGVQENKWTGEFDNVIVRGSLRVFEMIISQLLGENDNRIFTGMMEVDHYDAESGRVYLNTQDGKLYNPFRRNDIIMVQQFNGMPNSSNDYYVTKNYELLITDAGCGSLEDGDKRLDWVTFTNFTSSMEGATAESLIKKKDTFVRVDNLSDSQRKGIIQLMTVGANTPYMDIIYGLKTDPNNALKGRLGNLKGIVHPILGELSGFGEFLNNLYAVGDFIIQRTGESVDSKLQVLENMFSSRFSQTSYELTNSDNYLENGQFLEQVRDDEDTIISCWAVDTTDESMFWADALGNPFMVNGLLSVSGNRKVSIDKMDGRQVLRLQNCGVKQLNAHIRQPGTHKEYQQPSGSTGDNGLKKPATGSTDVQDRLYISIRIFAKTAGTLTVGFEGCSSVSGKSNTLTAQNVAVPYSGDWTNIPLEGVWNGTGNFVLRYTGDCYIAIASITDKPLSEFSKSVSTQIKQTATNIQLLGENIDKVNGKTTQLGIDMDAEKGEIRQYVDTKDKKNREDTSSLITQTSSSITSSVDKKLKNQYDTITSEYSSSITQKADQITLKVSAAQTAADNAQSAADAAQGTADTAINKNAELKVTVDGIGSKVDTKIANAKGEITKEYTSAINQSAKDITLKVSAAQTAADNAQSAADAAQGTADTAINKNAELKVTVDGIGSKVDTKIANAKGEITKEYTSAINQSAKDITLKVSAAQTAADNAQSAADAAQGTADTAINKNAELKVTVDGIGSKVDTKIANAKGEITKEYTSAINQSAKDITLKVSAAQTAADNAQSAADAAQGTADTAKKSVAELKVTMDGISTTVANKADTSTLNSKVSALNTSISSAKKSAIDTVNARIDGGVAEFYQQASPPSFTNLGWTKAECQRHAGALWYVVEPGTKGYVTGHLYRFVVMRGTGGAWEDVDDSIDSATTVQQNASGWNVASGMFDAKGNLTASGVASITPTVTTIANKSIDDKKGEIISGLMVKSDFSSLFSKAFDEKKGVVQADISTFVTKTAAGEMISNATIQADQINLTGHTMAFTGGQITITTDNFTLDGSGNMWCQNGTFSGTVTGVHGSFKKLDCVDSNGNVVGSIKFGSDGRLWFSGDMYHQGYDNAKKRNYRFYAADILCRGMFGHRQKTVAYVFNTYMAIYNKDSDDVDHYVIISLESGTESGKTYNKIPLFGFADYEDTSGFAIDVVVINSSSDFYYVFEGMGNGKEWRVINGNDKQTIHFADIGGWHELKGGESLSCVYVVPRLLSPTPSGLGAGVFWSGEADLNWS